MTVAERVRAVRERIRRAAEANGRDPDDILIVAASKHQPIETLRAAAEAGVTRFGESYVQQLREKCDQAPDLAFEFIGHLQRNKAKFVAPMAHRVQSVDSVRLADALERAAATRREATLEVLMQVNIGEEATKDGVLPAEAASLARHVSEGCPHLRLTGLMTLPPPSDPRRWHTAAFALRARLRDELGLPLPELSMGTSGDLEEAIACGATIVRPGTALLGDRA